MMPLFASACSAIVVVIYPPAKTQGQTLYWDINDATAGAGGPTPAGNWDSATPNWTTDPTGQSPTQTWVNGQAAVFSAGADATGGFTVAVNASQTAAGITFQTGAVTLSGGEIDLTGSANISTTAGLTSSIASVLGGTAGLTTSGAGTLALSASNTYSGATTVSAGVLDLKHAAAFGNSAGVSVTSGAAIHIDGSGLVITTPLTALAGNGVSNIFGALRNLANANTYSGNITLAASSRVAADAGTLAITGEINGTGILTITGSGNVNLIGAVTGTTGVTKIGTGTLTLTGDNTQTIPYTAGSGTMKLAASERIPDTAALSVNGTFDMAGFNETIGSLAGSGTLLNVGTLTFGAANTNTTFSGAISGGTLNKMGAGTQNLNGSSTYSGQTTVSTGVLAIVSGSALGAATAGTTVASGAALYILGANQTIAEPLTLNGAGIANAGALRKNPFDNTTLTGVITLDTASRINCDGQTLVIKGNISNAGNGLTVGGVGNMAISAAITGTGSLLKDGSGTTALTGVNTYSGNTTVSAGKLLINSPGSLASAISVNSGATFGGTGAAGAVTINSGGHLSPGASIGTLTLSGDLFLASASLLDYELGPVGASDKIAMVSSTLTLNGQQFSDFSFTTMSGFGPGKYVLIDADIVQGSLGPNTSGLIGTRSAILSVIGNDLVLTVPEPTDSILAATSFAMLAMRRRPNKPQNSDRQKIASPSS